VRERLTTSVRGRDEVEVVVVDREAVVPRAVEVGFNFSHDRPFFADPFLDRGRGVLLL